MSLLTHKDPQIDPQSQRGPLECVMMRDKVRRGLEQSGAAAEGFQAFESKTNL